MGTLIPPEKKKKEELGSKFKCNYSGHGKTASQVFDDKNLVSVEAKWVGRRREKLSKNWVDRDKAYYELMWIMGQKVQCEILAGRTGHCSCVS